MIRKKTMVIEITDSEIRLLGVRGGKNKLLPSSVSFQRKGLSSENLLFELEETLRHIRIEKDWLSPDAVYLLIPFENGLIREFRLPWMPKREREKAIHFYLQQDIPRLIDDLVYDYQVLEEENQAGLQVSVIGAKRERVDFYRDCFKKVGYDLDGLEYSLTALGEYFADVSGTKGLFIREVSKNKLQFALFKGTTLDMVRDLSTDLEDDIQKYHLYFGLQPSEPPIENIFIDGSSLAESATLVLRRTLSKQLSEDINDDLLRNNKLDIGGVGKNGFPAYALLAEYHRVIQKKNNNFIRGSLRKAKAKLARRFAVVVMASTVFFSCSLGAPLYKQLIDLQKERLSLEEQVLLWERQETDSFLEDWKKNQLVSARTTDMIYLLLAEAEKAVTLTKVQYQSDLLTLQGECAEEQQIKGLMEDLLRYGWLEPLLVDYRYELDKIYFRLSAKK